MARLITINKAVKDFKLLIERSILDGGNEAKTSMIRSSKPILNIHKAVKSQLISCCGVNKKLIYPPFGKRSPELKLAGSLKQKSQDICVKPNDIDPNKEILKTGLLEGITDEYGKVYTERMLAINIRSQISSIGKNFDTLYERTILEAQNLHERCPKMVLGDVYLIAIPEYDDKAFGKKLVNFKPVKPKLIEKYIKSFQAINNRQTVVKDFYKYESVCLLIVDFRKKSPKIYQSTPELIKAKLLPKDTHVKYEGLEWKSFAIKLVQIYGTRFGKGILT